MLYASHFWINKYARIRCKKFLIFWKTKLVFLININPLSHRLIFVFVISYSILIFKKWQFNLIINSRWYSYSPIFIIIKTIIWNFRIHLFIIFVTLDIYVHLYLLCNIFIYTSTFVYNASFNTYPYILLSMYMLSHTYIFYGV